MKKFTPESKMFDLVEANYHLLAVMQRLGILGGFGEHTVREICEKNHLDPDTFILLCDVYSRRDYTPGEDILRDGHIEDILRYLHQSHDYYTNNALVLIVNTVEELIKPCSELFRKAIWGFINNYKAELDKHFQFEEGEVIPYVQNLLLGKRTPGFSIDKFEENHSNIAEKLSDLKNIILKSLPQECDDTLRVRLLNYIYGLENDLDRHTHIEDDILVDMYPLLEEYSHNYWGMMMEDPTFYRNVVNDEGQVPTLIGMYKDPYYTDQGMWIRQDILDRVGLDVPKTLDELEAVLEAFKGEGLTDPIVILSEGQCDLLSRAYDAGDKLVDGKVVSNALTDNSKDMLKKMHEWYDKGYINVDFVTYTYSNTKPPQDVVLSDNGGMFVEDVASIAGYYLMSNNPDFNLQPMGQIRLTPDQKLNTGFIGVRAADKYSLSMSTNCEDQQLAIQYMDYLFSDEGFVLANYGIEGYTYTVENGEYQFTDLILANPQGFDWQLCQSLYINPGFPCLNDLHAQELTYNDAQRAAVPTWSAAYDSSDETIPNQNFLSYTTEESYRQAELQTDLETVQSEFRLKAITGQLDIDKEWDAYVQQCKDMGSDELLQITQNAVDRYLNK